MIVQLPSASVKVRTPWLRGTRKPHYRIMLLCQSSSSAANEDGFDPTLGCVVAAEIEEMNKARGQRMGEAREREVDAKGRSFATGHKKTAIARVCLTPGEGLMHVNGKGARPY